MDKISVLNIADTPSLNTMWAIKSFGQLIGVLSRAAGEWQFCPNFLGGKTNFTGDELSKILDVIALADRKDLLEATGLLAVPKPVEEDYPIPRVDAEIVEFSIHSNTPS